MMPRPGWFAGWQIDGWRAARGTRKRYALDERAREVGQARTTGEAAEQAREPGAEVVEGRGLRKGNAASKTSPGLSAGQGAPSALGRVRRIAKQDKEARFIALLHDVDVDRLRAAYWALNPRLRRGWMGHVGGVRAGVLRQTFVICMPGSMAGAIERSRRAGRTYRSQTGGCGRSGSQRWRTSSCSGGGRGAERCVRGGLPGLLLRVSVRA